MKDMDKNMLSDDQLDEVTGGTVNITRRSARQNDLVYKSRDGKRPRATNALMTEKAPAAIRLGGNDEEAVRRNIVSGGAFDVDFESGSC